MHSINPGTMQEPDTQVDWDEKPAFLDLFVELTTEILQQDKEEPVTAFFSPDVARKRLQLALPQEGQPLADVAQQLSDVVALAPTTTSRRFFNQLFGGMQPAPVLAELMTVICNASMYTYKAAGAQILVENTVLRGLANLVGWAASEGSFNPGGSISNLVALVVARNECLKRNPGKTPWDLVVYTSEESHYSIAKSVNVAGLRPDHLRKIPVDAAGRLRVELLRQAVVADLDAGLVPAMMVATAATTVRGAFDPIEEMATLAAEHDVWLHVDGAFGASVLVSQKHRGLMRGVELADSLTWDPHKMLGVPLTSSVLLCRHEGMLTENLSVTADYLFQQDTDRYNPGTRSLQCGRRNDALKVWALWQHLGLSGLEALVDRQLELASYAADLIRDDPRLTLTEAPSAATVCFEVTGHDSRAICEQLALEQLALVGHALVRGRRVIRLSCVNSSLAASDIDAFFDALAGVQKRQDTAPAA
ncbi:MAG: glutamate/tyrosine decarboxylase-like PLP-dependent enzyme [Myxococcota bacterium]|jgi:glutamate/tyrosine decarboxylase-like PLP-dependent enzyme